MVKVFCKVISQQLWHCMLDVKKNSNKNIIILFNNNTIFIKDKEL